MASEDVFCLVGQLIDNTYRVIRQVGEGGFGVVYQAEDEVLRVPVAIKCLKVPAHFTPEVQAQFFEKFVEEARMLAKLRHPSIVSVYRFGRLMSARGEIPYLALEWLAGRDLEHALQERRQQGRPFTERDAVLGMLPVVEAIALAHRRGIAHRDLKPANIFLVEEEGLIHPKVLDFGIAKVMQEGETATQVATKTSSGFSAFSPPYGAPEQFHSKRHGVSGPWTDVHALGLIMTDLVTLRAGFGDDQAECLLACLQPQRPTPRMCGVPVSDAFEAIVAKALALHPRDRFAHAGEMLAALQAMAGIAVPIEASYDARARNETEFQAPTPFSPPMSPNAPPMTPTTPIGPPMAAWSPNAPPIARPTPFAPAVVSTTPMRADAFGPPTHPTTATPVSAGHSAVPEIPALPPEDPVPTSPSALVIGLAAAGIIAVGVIVYAVSTGGHSSTSANKDSNAMPTTSLTNFASPTGTSTSDASAVSTTSGACPSTMVAIPEGTFSMPSAPITVSAFCLDTTEVTVGAYEACVNAGTCSAPDTAAARKHCNWQNPEDRKNHPVNCVSWDQAVAYCASVGGRLPTEPEWEWAARNGDNAWKYAWGNEAPDATKLNACGKECLENQGAKLFADDDHFVETAPVGSFPKYGFGLADMSGNVWEWTNTSNPGKPKEKIVKGACWSDADIKLVAVSSKISVDLTSRDEDVGFRCAKGSAPSAAPTPDSTPSPATNPAPHALPATNPVPVMYPNPVTTTTTTDHSTTEPRKTIIRKKRRNCTDEQIIAGIPGCI